MKSKQLYFEVANVCFSICCSDELCIDSNYQQYFVVHPKAKDIIECNIIVTNNFKPVKGNIVYHGNERIIFDDNGIETRVHFFNNEPFGIYRELSSNEIEIEVIQSKIDILFLELFSLEKYLLRNNALVLHSSFVRWNDKGIVFTAPSGTGKSTQADLWNKYENAKIINGDRSILIVNEDFIEVCGLPFCGSSKINLNERVPLNSIVFISQAPYNKVTYRNGQIAAMDIYKEVSINYWNKDAVTKAFEVIDEIVSKVNLLSLECAIDKEAVDIVREIIK